MGGKGRKSNKMFVSAKERTEDGWGGAPDVTEGGEVRPFTRLKFDCCSLSFHTMTDPVATQDGTAFERANILEYIDQFGTHPRTGDPLKMSDIFPIKFHVNADGEMHCPVTFKVFTEHSHIVAIKPTGNAYSFDAVNEMNIKFKNFRDLLDDTPFVRKDIVTLQDPHNIEKQNWSAFYHVQQDQKVTKVEAEDEPPIEINANSATQRILDQLKKKDAKVESTVTKLKVEEEARVNALFDAYKDEQDDAEDSSEVVKVPAKPKEVPKPKPKPAPTPAPESKPLYSTLPQGQLYASAGITSTAVTPLRKDRKVDLNEEQLRQLTYNKLRMIRKKAYVRLFTNLGDLNLELITGASPRACDNFITHCMNGYYDGTVFHRSIKNFMIQGGDPTGTGSGGESIFGDPFEDEFNDKALVHEGKGVVSMANSGPNTNKSQFFITYKSAKHLDGKHTIFGKVVGGFETLAKMERTTTDKDDRPTETITFLRAEVFVNPIAEIRQQVLSEHNKVAPTAEEEAAKQAAQDELDKKAAWFSNPTSGFVKPQEFSSGVGKYIQKLAGQGSILDADKKAKKKKRDEQADLDVPVAPAAKVPKSQSWDFSTW